MVKFEPIGTHDYNPRLCPVTQALAALPIGSEFVVKDKDAKNIRVRARYYAQKRGIKIRVLKADGGFIVRAYAADGAQDG